MEGIAVGVGSDRRRGKKEKRERKDEEKKREKKEKKEKEQTNELHRQKLVQELLNSEKSHVAALDIVVNRYLNPLETSNPPVIPQSMVSEIFSNLALIRKWHQAFLAALETHLELGDNFGDVFVDMIPLLRQLYVQYHENFDHAMETFEKAKKNKQFALFLEKKQKEIGENKDLLTYLYLPVQRMIAYDSLLKDIVALLPEDNEDYNQLDNSLKALRQIQYNATQRAKQRKNIDKVIEIQNRLSDATNLALPHRRYVYEGEALLVQADGETFKERMCFLFNDLFVCCKMKKKGQLEVDFKEPLETLRVEGLSDTGHFRHLFKLISSANEYILSSHEKQQWMSLITLCKKEWTHLRSPEGKEETAHNEVEESSREYLINKIVSWSKLEDAKEIQRQVKELALILEKYKAMHTA